MTTLDENSLQSLASLYGSQVETDLHNALLSALILQKSGAVTYTVYQYRIKNVGSYLQVVPQNDYRKSLIVYTQLYGCQSLFLGVGPVIETPFPADILARSVPLDNAPNGSAPCLIQFQNVPSCAVSILRHAGAVGTGLIIEGTLEH